MDYRFQSCIEKGRLVKIPINMDMVKRERKTAEYDLDKARDSLSRKDFKWATIQAYYSMFHCCKALLYSKGYREKSHRCLLIVIKSLFGRVLENRFIQSFSDAMILREEADYDFRFSESSSRDILEDAEMFLARTKGILNLP